MGAILPTLQLGMAYCCCNTTSSLCNACFGNTDPSTDGRKRSVLLLSLSIAMALLFQYSFAPSILHESGWWNVYRHVPGLGKMLHQAWTEGCEDFDDNDASDDQDFLKRQCAGNAGVYRSTVCSTLFFLLSAMATYTTPSLNRQAWPAKYGCFLLLLVLTTLIPNPFFLTWYLPLARIGAAMFILIQQVILVDMAYNWNETWMEKSDDAERLEWGSGKHWLRAILITAISLYGLAMMGIGFLYHFFSCSVNTTTITLTLLGILAITILQLTGEEGSLLTTSVLAAYVTYLAYSIVSKHPQGECNPTLGSNDVTGIVLGLFFTMLSLAWTAWSWTAQERLQLEGIDAPRSMNAYSEGTPNPNDLDLDVPFLNADEQPTSGVVVDSSSSQPVQERHDSSLWKLNVVLALVSCWVACSLTGWGSIQGGIGEGGEHTAANPMVGRWNMAMIGIAEGLVLGLYAWTLVAPRIFPDRDFS